MVRSFLTPNVATFCAIALMGAASESGQQAERSWPSGRGPTPIGEAIKAAEGATKAPGASRDSLTLPAVSDEDKARRQASEMVQASAASESEVAPPSGPLDQKAIEKIVADAIKKKEEEKKKSDEAKAEQKKAEDKAKRAEDLFGGTRFDLQTLYNSLHRPNLDETPKKWYEKLQIRGYTQVRFGRTLTQDDDSADPNLLGDRSINGAAENFSIRRARFILFGDVSDHLYLYFQPDFASTPQGATQSTFFGQVRDLYADVYVDTTKIHRFRVGASKIPYGWENMQSSQNRVPLDRSDALNTGVAPSERDLGVFYYWTPEEKQKLLKVLVDSGLKGSGNYGIFGVGVYNGQGASVFEQNLNLHTIARLTCPWQLRSGQVVEASIQGYTGEYTVSGAAIRPLGVGAAATPRGTGAGTEILDQRAAVTFVWYPQPFGFQTEWQVGRGPGLNDAQTEVVDRSLNGGYVMGMYRHETECYGIVTPYVRWQQYNGGYRHLANAPYGHQRELDLGVEWQMRREMELVMEYSVVDTPNFVAQSAGQSYRDFEGNVLRFQFQVNY